MILLTADGVSFTSFIPTSILGLVGLISAYLYFYFKHRDDNKLSQIKSAKPEHRARIIEMVLNDIGLTVDTSTLDSDRKLIVMGQILKAKTRKYLIISLTSIILCFFVAFLLYQRPKDVLQPPQPTKTINTQVQPSQPDVKPHATQTNDNSNPSQSKSNIGPSQTIVNNNGTVQQFNSK